MGNGVHVECKNCGEAETYMLGVGMMHDSLELMINNIKSAARKKAMDIMQNHNVMDGEFEY